MNFIFSWQKQYFTRCARSKSIVLLLENKIHIFAPPCNILYIIIVPEKPLWEGNNKVCMYVCKKFAFLLTAVNALSL